MACPWVLTTCPALNSLVWNPKASLMVSGSRGSLMPPVCGSQTPPRLIVRVGIVGSVVVSTRVPVLPLGSSFARKRTVTSSVPPAGTVAGSTVGASMANLPVVVALVSVIAPLEVLLRRTVAVSRVLKAEPDTWIEYPTRDMTRRSLNGAPSMLRATRFSMLTLLTTNTTSFHSQQVELADLGLSSAVTTYELATVEPSALRIG